MYDISVDIVGNKRNQKNPQHKYIRLKIAHREWMIFKMLMTMIMRTIRVIFRHGIN